MKNNFKVALCGMITALSIVFMLIGSLFSVLVYCSPILAGICVAIVAEEFGAKYAVCVYCAVSVLAMVLVSDKEEVIVFLLLAGFYPILKYKIKKQKIFIRIAIKALYINLMCSAYYFIAITFLGIPKESFGTNTVFIVAIANFVMFTYDLALSRSIEIYKLKIQNKLLKK